MKRFITLIPLGRLWVGLSVLYVMVWFSTLTNTAFAQSSNGSVRGSVRDQTGAVIPAANVALTNKATNVTLRTTTNEAGLYVFPPVIPGEYSFTVDYRGMEKLQTSLRVQVQVSTTFDAVLKLGSSETTITVSDVTPVVVNDSPALGHVLERQRIEQLPLNGRSIDNLLVTVPGLESPKPFSLQVRSWGLMAGAHDYYLDGAALSEQMWAEGTIPRPPGLDTIQEFKVENSASSAKYKRMTSIILSTKSGTNDLHGTAFETNRNNAYGKARSRTDFGEFPKLSRNEFGANLGGPVFIPKLYNGKNRTFFFSAYEASRNNAPTSLSAFVPTKAMRNGDFSGLVDSQGRLTTIYDPLTTNTQTWARQPFNFGGQLNRIDPSRISPLAKYVFSVMPEPTFPDRNPLLEPNWFGPSEDNTNEWTITERIDHRFSDKDTFYGRYTQGGLHRFYNQYTRLGNIPSLDGVSNLVNDDHVNRSLALSSVHTFSPTLINEILFSYSYTWRNQVTGEPGVNYNAQLGLPNPFNQTGFPYISNIGMGPFRYLRPANANERHFSYYIVEDNVTKVWGKHELQFGMHLRYDKLKTLPQQVLNTGVVDFGNPGTALYDPSSSPALPLATQFTGSPLANLFLGIANYNTPLRKGVFNLRRHEHAFYFQNNIKVTPRFTLNLGIRWQLSPFIGETNNLQIPGFDPKNRAIVLSQPLDKLYEAGVTVPSIIQRFEGIGVKFETYQQAGLPQKGAYNNWRDIGPHLGAAYRLGDGAKSFVIRGGYSQSFFNDGLWTWMDQSAANTPYTADFPNFSLTDPAQSPDGIANYGMRSVPTIIAGLNSKDAVSLTSPLALTPGSTSTYYFNPHQPTNYVRDWNVTIEKEIMANTLVRAGYVGNHSGNQGQTLFYNEQTPAYIWYVTHEEPLPSGFYSGVARRPFDNTTYGSIVEYRKSGFSNFSGAHFQLERRYSKGLAFQLTYVVGNTFRAGDEQSAGGYASPVPALNQFLPGAVPADYDQRNRFLNYARDASSPKHRLKWNYIVDLPFGSGKAIGGNAHGFVNALIGGWQVAGLGSLNSTYLELDTGNWNLTGEPIHQYGYQYPIQDCRSGTCYPGYLWWNNYIPVNRINSVDANGKPNGVMGVPADYKPAVTPLIPWGSTTLPANAPSNTSVQTFWDTNTVWVKLKDGTVQRTSYNTGLHPLRNQFIPGPLQWNLDASAFKRFRIREGMEARFSIDAFNVFNHPNNFGTNGAQNFQTSGGILDTRGQSNLARQLQLSVRFSW